MSAKIDNLQSILWSWRDWRTTTATTTIATTYTHKVKYQKKILGHDKNTMKWLTKGSKLNGRKVRPEQDCVDWDEWASRKYNKEGRYHKVEQDLVLVRVREAE